MLKKLSIVFICLMSLQTVGLTARVNNSSQTCFLRLKACSYQYIHNSKSISDKDVEYAQEGCDRFMRDCEKFIPGVCTTLETGNYICDTKESVETMFIQRAKTDKVLREKLKIALSLDNDRGKNLQKDLDSDLNPRNLKNPFKDEYDYKNIVSGSDKEENNTKEDNVRIINVGF